MTRTEDRDWEAMLASIDLATNDDDLAAAERQLRELTADEVVEVRPEWVEATVALATAPASAAEEAPEPVEEPAPAPQGSGWWRRTQRLAAAAMAFVSLHAAATAATVTVVTVVTVTAVVLLWPSGQHSNTTMPFRLALEIQLRADQPEGDRLSALVQACRRIKAVVLSLRTVRDRADEDPVLVEAARNALVVLGRQLAGTVTLPISEVDDTLVQSLAIVQDASQGVPTRLFHLTAATAVATSGIAAIVGMSDCTPRVEDSRRKLLAALLDEARK